MTDPTMRTSITALTALLTLTACELLPCEFNPAACDTDASASATAGDTDETDGPLGPCPPQNEPWGACAGDAQCPSGKCADGICGPACTIDGEACSVEVVPCDGHGSTPLSWAGLCDDGACR